MKVNAGLSEIDICLEHIHFIIMSSPSTIISKINLFNTPYRYKHVIQSYQYSLGPSLMMSPQFSFTEAPLTRQWLTSVPSDVPRSCRIYSAPFLFSIVKCCGATSGPWYHIWGVMWWVNQSNLEYFVYLEYKNNKGSHECHYVKEPNPIHDWQSTNLYDELTISRSNGCFWNWQTELVILCMLS